MTQDLEKLKEWIGQKESAVDYVTIPAVHRLAARPEQVAARLSRAAGEAADLDARGEQAIELRDQGLGGTGEGIGQDDEGRQILVQ